jgi:dTDP-4-dehydrorhamnose 3,5-epimerase
MGGTIIDGLLITPLNRVLNPKGDIYHAIKASSPGYQGFGEAYFSSIIKGYTKGWKRHNLLALNIVVPLGEIRFVIYDDRPNSPSTGNFADITLGHSVNYSRLTIPKGLWVAFQGVGDFNLLMNIISMEHDPSESDNIDLLEIDYPGLGG